MALAIDTMDGHGFQLWAPTKGDHGDVVLTARFIPGTIKMAEN